MYSRKIKQMKKKLLNSSNTSASNHSSKNSAYGGGNPNSGSASNGAGSNGGSRGGGGGLHPNWGPRVALIELEQKQQRIREEQEYLRAQELYNKARTQGAAAFKNPHATSGIGIHTPSVGFICKTNKKLVDSGPLKNRSQAVPPPKPSQRPEGLRNGIQRHLPPPLPAVPQRPRPSNNDSLASTKTYHSSGGSSVSLSVSSRSSTPTSSGSASSLGHHSRSSLILGSDHEEDYEGDRGYGYGETSGSYNITSIHGIRDPPYPGLIPFDLQKSSTGAKASTSVGGGGNKGTTTEERSTLNNVKLLNVHQIYEERRGSGFYNKNITGAAVTTKIADQGQGPKAPSKLLQRFSMVYVPMEVTKPSHTDKDYARRQLKPPEYRKCDSDEMQVPPLALTTITGKENSASGFSSGPGSDIEENRKLQRQGPTCANSNGNTSCGEDSLLESFDSIMFKPGAGCETRPQALPEDYRPAYGTPPPIPAKNGLTAHKSDIYRKKTPPPLPPKKPQSQGGVSVMPTPKASKQDCNSNSNKTPTPAVGKSLRFSDHLDIKSPSPYEVESTGERGHNGALLKTDTGTTPVNKQVQWGRSGLHFETGGTSDDFSDSQLQPGECEDGQGQSSLTTMTATGPASLYSACTTTTLLSCGHLRDNSYSTLSSINSAQISDNEGESEGHPKKPKQVDPLSLIETPEKEDDELTSSKSALQQLRDLSILIGGSFHTSTPPPPPPAHGSGNSSGDLQRPIPKFSVAGSSSGNSGGDGTSKFHSEDGSKTGGFGMRKSSTDDSGKGSATGSGRSRSGCSGSAADCCDSMSQLQLKLAVSTQEPKHRHLPRHEPAQEERHTAHGKGRERIRRHQQGNSNSSSACSCSFSGDDNSSLSASSCLFSPDCEACQQVFRNPHEETPNLQPSVEFPLPRNSKPNKPTRKTAVARKDSKAKVARRNSYKLPTKKKVYPSAAAVKGMTTAAPLATSSSSQVNQRQFSIPGPKCQWSVIVASASNTCPVPDAVSQACTKTELLLTKAAAAVNGHGCLGCYQEQLVAAGLLQGPSATTTNGLPLFTIDEAAEENDGTLQHQQQSWQRQTQISDGGQGKGRIVQYSSGPKVKRAKSRASAASSKYARNKKKSHKKQTRTSSSALDHAITHEHPKCWLATDATMGWSDLESMYSQNIRKLEEGAAAAGVTGSVPSLAMASGFLKGECINCWKELIQYKDNAEAGDGSNYTVERTKRMFIWLNRRPKEFTEPWWEAKKQASIKWLVTKAYIHLPKGSIQNPFRKSSKDNCRTKTLLKDQVMAGLATGKLYCMALENLFSKCTAEEQQSIFGQHWTYFKGTTGGGGNGGQGAGACAQSHQPLNKSPRHSLRLSHWEIIKILSRKGIYVAQPSDMKLTEGTLRQKKPFRITAHVALIEAVMGLYAKVMLTRDKVMSVVSNLGIGTGTGTATTSTVLRDAQTPEEFLLAWINAVISTLKAYVLSAAGGGASAAGTSGKQLQRWLNVVHPFTDLRDLYDGIALCALFALYFSNRVSLTAVCINEPDEPLDIYDCIRNHMLLQSLYTQLIPEETIYHIKMADLLYVHGYMKQNLVQLLIDIFYYTEIAPMSHVTRLTHVPLRIQL